MKKILITGGAGFVGTHLVNELSKDENNSIIVFDNLSSGKKENIPDKPNITFFQGDVQNKEDLKKAFSGVDQIVHLAAIISVTVCEQSPKLCDENNIKGTQNVFEVAQELGISKIVYASSAAVYGELSSPHISETDITTPISNYGKSKLENEKTALSFAKDIQSIGLRFFNIYGPGLSMENAYPSVLVAFFKKINEGKPITVYGDGSQTRDFVHVYDIVQAITKALEIDTESPLILNVGTGKETTILELAQKTKEVDTNVSITFEQARDFDISQSCADITKIKSILNFNPTHTILEDLSELLKFYRK